MVIQTRNVERFRIESLILGIATLLFIFRASNPLFKYPFIPLYSGFVIYTLITYHRRLKDTFKEIISSWLPLLASLAILILSFFFSYKFYEVVFKDIVGALVVFSFFFLYRVYIRSGADLDSFLSTQNNLILLFAFLISFLGMLDLLDILPYSRYFLFTEVVNNSIPIDYNFALLPVLYGLLLIINDSFQKLTRRRIAIYSTGLILFIMTISFSGSKRGIIMLTFLIVSFVILKVIQYRKHTGKSRLFNSNTNFYIIALLSFGVILYGFFSFTSFSFKNRTLRAMGSNNYIQARANITTSLYRYLFLFKSNLSYDSLYKKIWSPAFNPNSPFSDWGVGNFRAVHNLKGENSEIVPKGSIGYLLDNTCSGGDEGHAYFATLIQNSGIREGEFVIASVYCFVSKDFDGNVAAIETDKTACGRQTIGYDLTNKGKWQKLILKVRCSSGEAPVYLYISKNGVSSFKSLKGHVIFAHPEYRIVPASDSTIFSERFNRSVINERKDDSGGIAVLKNQDVNAIGREHELLDMNSAYQIKGAVFPISVFPDIFFRLGHNALQDTLVDNDPIRIWFGNLLKEDTTYLKYQADLKVIKNGIQGEDDRPELWSFALQIYGKEYNFLQKIFGKGFAFLNWYGYNFENDKTKTNHPHNPFLYIILYSGIVGIALYLYLLFKVFRYYLIFLKNYYIYFYFFLITYFFTIISGSNPFDPPVMGYFIILPFFLNTVLDLSQKKRESAV